MSLLDTAKSRISAVVDRSGVSAVRSIPELGAVAVRPAAGESLGRARRDLRADPAVKKVEVERSRTLRYLPDDPALAHHDAHAPSNDVYQWNLRQEHFPKAWRRTRGARARLAVIDTGVDGGNPDLSGRLVYSKGYDYRGCGGRSQPPCTGPRHDEVGHGTHVAGLACGEGNNGVGIAGAAFACKLIDEKVSDTEDIEDSLIAKSITDATDHGADVISMSFGGPGASGVINHALDYAFSHDVVLVAAASNANTTHQGAPASHLQPNGTGQKIGSGKGLVVTAAGHNNRRAWFRPGHGTGISLAAYGSASGACRFRSDCGIFSTFPDNDTRIEQGPGLRRPLPRQLPGLERLRLPRGHEHGHPAGGGRRGADPQQAASDQEHQGAADPEAHGQRPQLPRHTRVGDPERRPRPEAGDPLAGLGGVRVGVGRLAARAPRRPPRRRRPARRSSARSPAAISSRSSIES